MADNSASECSPQDAVEADEHVPTVSERLGQLRPSRELLEYYRAKIAEYDGEYEKLMRKLDKYKCAYEQVHKSEWEIRQREEEIVELQQALSDMQVFLFQEREHVLRLYSENDRLKIRELEDRKRIQHLLSLTQPVNSETTYFHKEPPSKVVVEQHLRGGRSPTKGKEPSWGNRRGPGGHRKQGQAPTAAAADDDHGESDKKGEDTESLLLTVEALKAQLEEQTRLCKDQVDSLLEDRRVKVEEEEALRNRDTERIKCLTDQLHMSQSLLYESTKDYLDLKYEYRAKERSWMVDRDQLLQELDRYREQMDISAGIDPVIGMDFADTPKQQRSGPVSVSQLRLQLQQTQHLADDYREQCIKMEEDLCKLREQTDASKDLFQQRTEKLTKRLALMNTRYEALEKRRNFEVEGYKNDIKTLRQRLREVEKQLYKLTTSLVGDQDMQILSKVKQTASRSKKLLGDLQNIKAKVYSLENDVRHVHDH